MLESCRKKLTGWEKAYGFTARARIPLVEFMDVALWCVDLFFLWVCDDLMFEKTHLGGSVPNSKKLMQMKPGASTIYLKSSQRLPKCISEAKGVQRDRKWSPKAAKMLPKNGARKKVGSQKVSALGWCIIFTTIWSKKSSRGSTSEVILEILSIQKITKDRCRHVALKHHGKSSSL